MSQFECIDKRVPIALDNPAITHDISKCKNCTLCRRACADVMSVLDYYDLESTGDVPMCIHCGQCAAACPFDSMHARSELDKVKAAVAFGLTSAGLMLWWRFHYMTKLPTPQVNT